MKKSLKSLLSLSVSLVLITVWGNQNIADNGSVGACTRLDFCQHVLDDFNEKYNTNYAFANEEQREIIGTQAEVAHENMLNMTEGELEQYLFQAYVAEQGACDPFSFGLESDESTFLSSFEEDLMVSPRTSVGEICQYWYYKGSQSGNYISVESDMIDVDGQSRYVSINSIGYSVVDYPAQVPTSVINAQILDNSQRITVSYRYDRYVAPNIIQTSVNSGVVSFYITDRVVY